MNPNNLTRTVRVWNDQAPGTLGRLLLRIAEAEGDVGELKLIQETHRAMIRDITIYVEDEGHLSRVIAAMASNPGTRVLAVRDEVLELHQKGKIAVRSRFLARSVVKSRLRTTRRSPGSSEMPRATSAGRLAGTNDVFGGFRP